MNEKMQTLPQDKYVDENGQIKDEMTPEELSEAVGGNTVPTAEAADPKTFTIDPPTLK